MASFRRAACIFGVLSLLGGMTAGLADSTGEPAAMDQVLNQYSRVRQDMVAEDYPRMKSDLSSLLSAAGDVKDSKFSDQIKSATKILISDVGPERDVISVQGLTTDFMRLSNPIVAWVKKNRPEGWSVMYCSKANGSWVQRSEDEILNPYGWQSDRKCGQKVA